jgi:hypothetical protein
MGAKKAPFREPCDSQAIHNIRNMVHLHTFPRENDLSSGEVSGIVMLVRLVLVRHASG